jgi:Zn-dependent M28 family amino/carboxypeptidase
MLAVARRMLQQPARRSALFVWHVAEEKGLLGSAYFTAHPTVPIDSVVAQINADMIGRNARDLLYIVGPRAAPDGQSRVLGAIVDSVNARQPQPFRLNSDWDAADTPEQYYQRSDHFNYARRGVPVVFFSTGLHDDYHAVSDEPSKIDYGKLARVSELMFQVGHGVANRESRLK